MQIAFRHSPARSCPCLRFLDGIKLVWLRGDCDNHNQLIRSPLADLVRGVIKGRVCRISPLLSVSLSFWKHRYHHVSATWGDILSLPLERFSWPKSGAHFSLFTLLLSLPLIGSQPERSVPISLDLESPRMAIFPQNT